MAQRINLEAWQTASSETPYDVSFLLKNPSGTENFGWNRNKSDAAAGYNKHNYEFASSAYNNTGIESWYWSPVKNEDLIWQDVEGLLAGTYRVTAFVVAQIYNDGNRKGQCGTGTYLFAGDAEIAVTSNKWQEQSVTVTIGDNEKLRIGIKGDSGNENDWVSIAGVRLECIGFKEIGSLSALSMDEKFDVSTARQFCFADVVLYRTLSEQNYTPLFLPFSLTAAQCKTYFSEVLLVSDAKAVTDNSLELVTAERESIKADTPYLVKGKKDGRTRIEASPVVINGNTEMSTTLPCGLILTGTYRSHEGMDGNYQLDTGCRMTYSASPSCIDGYSFYLSTNK